MREGKIRRVTRGLYDSPEPSERRGGMPAPDFVEAAHAIARKTGTRVQPTGAFAAHLLGLSAVPVQRSFVSQVSALSRRTVSLRPCAGSRVELRGPVHDQRQGLRNLFLGGLDPKEPLSVRKRRSVEAETEIKVRKRRFK